MRKAALHNLGCKVNAYETESMRQMLEQAGYKIVPFGEEADVYVVNTCSVTNIADRKSRQMLHRAKKKNPDSVVVAAGCYVQTSKEQAQADGAVDILIGNNRKHELVGLLEQYFQEHPPKGMEEGTSQPKGREPGRLPDENAGCHGVQAMERKTHPYTAVGNIAEDREYEALSISSTGEHTRAFLKVQDGCNQFCSYCIIPYARGRVRSRDMGEVVREVETLAREGYREIVLTGIHLSSYGTDWVHGTPTIEKEEVQEPHPAGPHPPLQEPQPAGPQLPLQEPHPAGLQLPLQEPHTTAPHPSLQGLCPSVQQQGSAALQKEGQGMKLLELIRRVHGVEGICRIRLGSLEPGIVTEAFAKELSKLHKVCPHFHLSLQSGCDATLQRMNRKYTCGEYERGCRLLREHFSHPAITTDVIVGFPGETEEEFEATREFLKRINFFEIHIFKYSLRKGTKAAQMEHQIPEETKGRRSDVLFGDLSAMHREYLEWHIGREVEVLMEEEVSLGGKRYFLGHTKEYVKAAIPLPEEGTGNKPAQGQPEPTKPNPSIKSGEEPENQWVQGQPEPTKPNPSIKSGEEPENQWVQGLVADTGHTGPQAKGEKGLENKLVRGTAASLLQGDILLLQNFSIFSK